MDDLNDERAERLRQKAIDTIQDVLDKTKLSARAGKYEALERANWLHQKGRKRLEGLVDKLKETDIEI